MSVMKVFTCNNCGYMYYDRKTLCDCTVGKRPGLSKAILITGDDVSVLSKSNFLELSKAAKATKHRTISET